MQQHGECILNFLVFSPSSATHITQDMHNYEGVLCAFSVVCRSQNTRHMDKSVFCVLLCSPRCVPFITHQTRIKECIFPVFSYLVLITYYTTTLYRGSQHPYVPLYLKGTKNRTFPTYLSPLYSTFITWLQNGKSCHFIWSWSHGFKLFSYTTFTVCFLLQDDKILGDFPSGDTQMSVITRASCVGGLCWRESELCQ